MLNVVTAGDKEDLILHFSGIKIIQRDKLEKDRLDLKNISDKAQNKAALDLNNELASKTKIIEKQLRQISRLNLQQQQIDKVLSHDLQEPLRKISFFASMLENAGEETPPYLTKILVSAERLRNLLKRMQRLHATDQKKLSYKPLDLSKIIKKSIADTALNETTVTIEAETISQFEADEELLVNLFVELLDNSIKFKDRERELAITISADHFVQNLFVETKNKYKYEKYLRITYTDNGIGFEDIYNNHIFDIFKKLHPNEGLGIGLTYIKRIVELHEGFITVTSTPNEGAIFTILLPLLQIYE